MSNPFADVQRAMSLYGLSTFHILGTVGNLLLACILLQQTHRRNSCSLYLLSATVVNFILIQCILPVAIYSANNTDPQTTSLAWCKTRSYLFNALLMLYRWYKMAACVDRAAMCSQRASVRTFSEARTARRVILLITIVWLLIPIHLAVFYRIESGRCVPQSGTYAKFFSVYSIFISGWSPPTVMAIFGIIAYRNLKQVIRSTFVTYMYVRGLFQIRERVAPTNAEEDGPRAGDARKTHQRIGRRDQQLMLLLMCEVLLYICTNLLFSINITYSAITADQVKTLERLRIEAFVTYLSTPFLIIINNCSAFYLYLLVSVKFRHDVKTLLTCWTRQAQTHPSQQLNMRSMMSGSTALQPGLSMRK